ncbi:sensor domain-containing phosphodiesterase [uncultured Pseudokineococcus sp.]|uniref:putative bifunctional diguanylate cyclase/phosphodiesterase n=1 Tax=uncultured Pseudokineococcus sp. TaxID=1642928 RepID=UPI0026095D1F|nr:sensor domain-containing phosphodiesterase [uncultured Pseudokineococcus sp.]
MAATPGGTDAVVEPSPDPGVDHGALTAVLSTFASSVTHAFTTRTVLTQLVRAVTDVLAVDGSAVMVADDDVLLRFAEAHGPLRPIVEEAERLQEVLQDGPCRESHDTGRVVDVADLRLEGRWPAYQAAAERLGLRAVTSVPLRARGRGWGVLDLYRSDTRRLAPHELAAARTLADVATSYLVVAADRDTAERAQAQLAHRAMHDPLTDLPVRWVLVEQLQRSLARLARRGGRVAVLFVDLDGLKYVNDTHGHAAGDDLLTACAQRMREVLRPSDLVARVGGDEFLVLLDDLVEPAEATDVAQRLLARVSLPHVSAGVVLMPSASIGVALTDDADLAPETLVAHADSAMYRAKAGGRGRVDSFDAAAYESHRAEATNPDQLLPALRAALEDGGLELCFQPLHDLGDGLDGHPPAGGDAPPGPPPRASPSDTARPRRAVGRLHAVEALLRWRRPGHGLVRAEEFILAAERSGLVVELGAWVLREVCAQLRAWDEALGALSPPRVFVNVSAVELADPGLADRVRRTLHETGTAPGRLVLEVTETSLSGDVETTAATVRSLVALGCELAIDDFGTGYSSLRRLVDLPATCLKVDRSFTRDLRTSPAAAAVVTAAVQLGRTLQRTVVVEGVEDEGTLQALLALGATHLQGYHLTRPLPTDEVTDRLAAW